MSSQKNPTDFDEKLGTSQGVWTGGKWDSGYKDNWALEVTRETEPYASARASRAAFILKGCPCAVTSQAEVLSLIRQQQFPMGRRDSSQRSPPKEPVLMCRSNNYPKGFYCSWHLPSPTYIPNSFNISVIHRTREMVCKKDIFPKNRCHIRYLQLFSTVKYKVTLTVTNALGKNSTTLTFDEFAIVKPDPPESVVAKPVPNNPWQLEVAWQNPSSWPDPESFPLKFFLRYRPLILDVWQHVELLDGTSHTITDAYAGKEYIIQAATKDNDIGTWNDWSVAVHATPWTEEPKHLTTEAQVTETTSASTSYFVPPPTTKICDKGAMVGSGAVAVCWTAGLVLAAYGVLFI
ncbi:ciliary neurotrophic factor receptor subunit alpha-like [Cygnus olor]|uniref:ciliary neurotrophic factor receptor subunit alpha-like n=1 Tax=Cygnus olor TaxID=8869 RepID=UPI001ADE2C16|nr:ciliary neurotrophic factor receptor subunit alpha-like [Cygnus olor]